MTFQEALKYLDQGRFAPLYLISGEEPFLIQRLLERFKERAIDPATRDFNYDLFQGEMVSPQEALRAAQTLPVLSPRRLVIIQHADLIKDESELFLAYFENPSETTVLLLVAPKPDLRKKMFSMLKKKAIVITCPLLSEGEVSRWIAQAARERGIRFSEEALWYLKERLGKDLFLIHQEVEKIASRWGDKIVAEGREVSLAEVQDIVGGGRSHSIFELVRTMGEKDVKESFSLLSALLADGESPLFILAMWLREWRMMAIAKEELELGHSEGIVGKKIGLAPFLLSDFFKRLKRWSPEEIREAFRLSLAADSQLKGGRQAPSFVLEALLLELCQIASRRIKGILIPFGD